MKALYRGYSSHEYEKSKNFRLTNTDIVKLDLLNHIFTRKGERVMMADFGTIIPELVFEPLDSETIDILTDELMRVFKYDPRVQLLEFAVNPDYDNNSITASSRLLFIELNVVDDFNFNIEFSA